MDEDKREDTWSVNSEWKQEWNDFNSKHIFLVTDENVLIDNIEASMEKSNFNVDLAIEMLNQIGVKQN